MTPTASNDGLAQAVAKGLAASRKSLPPKFFYDELGSQLFEAICLLPEYYLTRAETEILRKNASDIVAAVAAGARLVELGAGSAVKTRILIQALLEREDELLYCPIDISEEAMRIAEANITSAFPRCRFKGIIGDWIESLGRLRRMDDAPRLILFLGSSIGNLDEEEAARLLGALRNEMGPRDRLLLGMDLVKPIPELLAAYDDATGVTAAFNKNLLLRINQELGADFDTRRFRHEARWDPVRQRIEMHLVSVDDQVVHVSSIGLAVAFTRGESIHTENSHKYTSERAERLFGRTGLARENTWQDSEARFALHLLRRAGR